ncbi:hypothetical protein KGQ96_05905 [Halomonas coralii]|uniref:hypothetical protein n=1 Tax=Modicisalibacter sp. R2A 31.J TaxID=2831898 RepID=UPI001CCA4396|nr:hypothetical protein [Modicisalibacter sp. R2A 31.J]MBZ9557593.1 hypothetical protein [Modicisalibacter sp. R2A 31.J]
MAVKVAQRHPVSGAAEPALLPNEPRVLDAARQQALTEQHLLAFSGDLEALFLNLRRRVDEPLRRACPAKRGKPYPLGQCLEISQAVIQHLAGLEAAGLALEARHGLRRLQAFHQAGGVLRQVWGDLRGDYFQNALLAGTLYVDVANDTVDRGKPPVEILPFAESGLKAIADYRHFARVTAGYWRGRAFANHALPALAAYFPLLIVTEDGFLQCQSACDYMLALNARAGFRPAEAVLRDAPMNASLFSTLRRLLEPLALAWPADPEAGRKAALLHCRRAREGSAAMGRDAAVRAVLAVNRQLARHRVVLRH